MHHVLYKSKYLSLL